MSRSPLHNDPNQLPPTNIIIAVVLSIAILMGFYFVFDKPRLDAVRAQELAKQEQVAQIAQEETEKKEKRSRHEIIKEEENLRLSFQTDNIKASISRKGGRIDDVSLLNYYTTTEKTELVHLLSPENSEKSHFAEFGWIAPEGETIALPDNDTIWNIVENSKFANDQKIRHRTTLSWDNKQGQLFIRTITVDNEYMFTIKQSVQNKSDKSASLYPYGLIARNAMPIDYSGFFVLHEGILALTDKDLEEIDYDDIERGENQTFNEQKGWIGFTDKYWFTGLIPTDKDSKSTLRYLRTGTKDDETFQTDMVGSKYVLKAGETIEHTIRLYAGAKVLSTLQNYSKEYDIPSFDHVIDFGIYYFLTKPLFILLTWLGHTFGHIGIGIIVLTIILKTLTFPLSYKAYKSMAMVSKMQPQIKKIKEKHKDDRETLQKSFMELYQKEGVNPFSGCWPMLIQIPIFFSLYKVILTNIMLRHVGFWGWIDDLSSKDPTSFLNLFGLLPFETPVLLTIGAWPCLMGLSMFMLNRMSPKPTDPTQALIKNYFPYMFAVMMARFASGLVIYWTVSNILTILQQYIIMKRMGVPISLIRGHLGHLEKKDEEESKS